MQKESIYHRLESHTWRSIAREKSIYTRQNLTHISGESRLSESAYRSAKALNSRWVWGGGGVISTSDSETAKSLSVDGRLVFLFLGLELDLGLQPILILFGELLRRRSVQSLFGAVRPHRSPIVTGVVRQVSHGHPTRRHTTPTTRGSKACEIPRHFTLTNHSLCPSLDIISRFVWYVCRFSVLIFTINLNNFTVDV